MVKSDLAGIQHWMQASLITPKVVDHSVTESLVSEVENMHVKDRLAIYQRSYYARLIECLRNQFKALVYTLDKGLFEEFCRMYLVAYPSQHASLSPLGDNFPKFIEETRPDKEEPELWIDFMIAMAQFELDLYKIFDREGNEYTGYAEPQISDCKLTLQKCVSLHQYPFRINHYYQEISNGNSPDISKPENTYIAFVRKDFQVLVIELEEMQYNFLEIIGKENNVKTAFYIFMNRYNLNEKRALLKWQEWRQDWIKKGFFIINE